MKRPLRIGIVILVLALLALRPDASRLKGSIVIHRPADEVWPWLCEPVKLQAWVSGLKEIRPGMVQSPAPGQKAVWVMNDDGSLIEIHDTVEAVVANRLLSVSLTADGGFRGQASYKLSPAPDGSTLLETDSSFHLDNLFERLMTPVIVWQARKKLMADLLRLRTLVEAPR